VSESTPKPDALPDPIVSSEASSSVVAPLYGLVAEFVSDEELIGAARCLRDAGYTRWDVFSPYPIHGIDQAMGIRPTRLPWFVLVAGLTGGVLAILMQWWTNAVDYQFLISGKPLFSLPANIPVTFEVIILFSAFTTFLGMLVLNRLAEFHHPLFSSERFARVTSDRFAIVVEASDPIFNDTSTRELLDDAGSLEVEECRFSGESPAIPKQIIVALAFIGLLAIVPPALVAKARASKSDQPPIRIDLGMSRQPKLKPQTLTSVFADGREQRLPVIGTVSRGGKQTDDHFYRGKIAGGAWAKGLPMPATPELIRRGQDRFKIYCMTCHGLAGYGDGPTAKRAEQLQEGTWVPPASMHADHVKAQPDGELFNTITNGIRNMMGYGGRIPPEDRWAIVLYVRALQRSQGAKLTDVPADVTPTPK